MFPIVSDTTLSATSKARKKRAQKRDVKKVLEDIFSDANNEVRNADNNDNYEISAHNDESSVQSVRKCVNEHLAIPEEIKKGTSKSAGWSEAT